MLKSKALPMKPAPVKGGKGGAEGDGGVQQSHPTYMEAVWQSS